MKKEEGGFAFNDARLARRWKRRALMSLNLTNCNKKEAQRKKFGRNNKSSHVTEIVDLESSDNEAQIKRFRKNERKSPLEVDDEMVDMDYMMFLNSSTGPSFCSNQANGVVVDRDNDRSRNDINDNDVDPDYKIFIDKLRKVGNAYAVEFDLSNGLSVLIKYEIENGSCIEHGLEETVTAASSQKEKNVAITRVLRSASKRLKMDGPIEFADVLSKGSTKSQRTFQSVSRRDGVRTERISPVAEKSVELEAKEPISCPTAQCSSQRHIDIHQTANKKCKHEMDCNIIDESYQEFLNYLNDLGKQNMESASTVRNVSRRDRLKTQRISPVAEKNVEREAEHPVSCLTTQHASKRLSQDILKRVQQKHKYEKNCYILDECSQQFTQCLKNDLSEGNSETPRTLKSVWRSDRIGAERKSSVIKKNVGLEVEEPVRSYIEMDEDYQEFLKGESLVFTPENTANKKDKETLSDSDIIAVDNDPFSDGKDNPFVPSKSYHSLELNNEGIWARSSTLFKTSRSSFREKLMDCLKKPFNIEEYDDLLSKVCDRRPVELERCFRNGTRKPYPSEALGKSYLDWHSDLAEKIKLYAMNCPKTLNLLRGFFYWLNNLAHEGSFRPWLDSACLEVMPEVLLDDFAC